MLPRLSIPETLFNCDDASALSRREFTLVYFNKGLQFLIVGESIVGYIHPLSCTANCNCTKDWIHDLLA